MIHDMNSIRMGVTRQNRRLGRNGTLGGLLVVVGVIAAILAFPPLQDNPWPNGLLPLIVAELALLLTILGGLLLSSDLAKRQPDGSQQALIHIVAPIVGVAIIELYYVVVLGFSVRASFLFVSLVFGLLAGFGNFGYHLLSRRTSSVVLLPVALLLLLGIFFEVSADYGLLGIYIGGVGFLGGVVFVALSLLLHVFEEYSEWSSALFFLGGSLMAGGLLLYLIFGCVFGCPG
jgi:hypothetical protein